MLSVVLGHGGVWTMVAFGSWGGLDIFFSAYC